MKKTKKTKKKKQYLVMFVVTDTGIDPRGLKLAGLTKKVIRSVIRSMGTADELSLTGVKTSGLTIKAWP